MGLQPSFLQSSLLHRLWRWNVAEEIFTVPIGHRQQNLCPLWFQKGFDHQWMICPLKSPLCLKICKAFFAKWKIFMKTVFVQLETVLSSKTCPCRYISITHHSASISFFLGKGQGMVHFRFWHHPEPLQRMLETTDPSLYNASFSKHRTLCSEDWCNG